MIDENSTAHEVAHTALEVVGKLQKALEGIASCATQCPCCEMHRQVAEKALGYSVEITTDRI